MSDTEIRRVERKGNHGRNTPWLVAAAVVTVVALAAVIAVLTRDSGPVANNGATTTSVAIDEPLDPAVQTVFAFIEAYNAGDAEAILAFVPPEEPSTWSRMVDGKLESGTSEPGDWMAFAMNAHMQVVEPCRVSEPQVVECRIAYSNDWHGPAGLNSEGVLQFYLDETAALVVDWEDPTWAEENLAFNQAFWAWLGTAHPDIAAWMTPRNPQWLPGGDGPASDMTLALEYLDEFLAQSPDYPTDSP